MIEYLYTSRYTTPHDPPDYSLPIHIKAFVLATEFKIPGLQAQAAGLFASTLNGFVSDLDVYFAAVRQVYASTTYQNPQLRIVVVEAAATEMRTLLSDDVKERFNAITHEIHQYHVCFLSP